MKRYPVLKFQLLSENAFPPKRATLGSSGLDVFSPIDTQILPWSDILIPLDVRFEIPEGWDLSVYNKSGVSTKKKLDKGAELIDNDFRGCVHVHLFNHSDQIIYIKRGDKISQLVMREVWMGDLEQVNSILLNTERKDGGFGSSGEKF